MAKYLSTLSTFRYLSVSLILDVAGHYDDRSDAGVSSVRRGADAADDVGRGARRLRAELHGAGAPPALLPPPDRLAPPERRRSPAAVAGASARRAGRAHPQGARGATWPADGAVGGFLVLCQHYHFPKWRYKFV